MQTTGTDVHTLVDNLSTMALKVLITGHVDLFMQAVGPALGPDAANAHACRIYVVDGPPGSREAITAACHQAVGSQALVTPCTIRPNYTIVVALLNGEAAVSNGAWDHIGTHLKNVIADRPDSHLGGSGIVSLNDAHQACYDAETALRIARRSPARAALHTADIRLAAILDSRADQWAADLLHPILQLPDGKRELLMETARVALAHTQAEAARLLNTSRPRVTDRLRQVDAMLDLDLTLPRDRAVLGLALEVHARPSVDVPLLQVGLSTILATEPVHAWAGAFLAQLEADGRPLRRTLITWFRSSCHIADTAAALGLKPAAIRDHLRAAQTLLSRHLIGSTPDSSAPVNMGGPHGVFMALAITGDVAVTAWPIPAGWRLRTVSRPAASHLGAS